MNNIQYLPYMVVDTSAEITKEGSNYRIVVDGCVTLPDSLMMPLIIRDVKTCVAIVRVVRSVVEDKQTHIWFEVIERGIEADPDKLGDYARAWKHSNVNSPSR